MTEETAAEEQPSAAPRPDAVLIPVEWSGEGNGLQRARNIGAHATRLLRLDSGAGEKPCCRTADRNGFFYCTASNRDFLFFPTDHRRFGQPRYRWEKQDDGSVLGYYVDQEARDVCHAKPR